MHRGISVCTLERYGSLLHCPCLPNLLLQEESVTQLMEEEHVGICQPSAKQKSFPIDGNALMWIKLCLFSRSYPVEIGDLLSGKAAGLYDVPVLARYCYFYG